MGREELARRRPGRADADPGVVRIDKVLVMTRAGYERVEQRVHRAAHSHVLAALAPVRLDRGDRGGEIRVVGEGVRHDQLVVPGAGGRSEGGVRGERGEADRRPQCVDLGEEHGLISGGGRRARGAGRGDTSRGRDGHSQDGRREHPRNPPHKVASARARGPLEPDAALVRAVVGRPELRSPALSEGGRT